MNPKDSKSENREDLPLATTTWFGGDGRKWGKCPHCGKNFHCTELRSHHQEAHGLAKKHGPGNYLSGGAPVKPCEPFAVTISQEGLGGPTLGSASDEAEISNGSPLPRTGRKSRRSLPRHVMNVNEDSGTEKEKPPYIRLAPCGGHGRGRSRGPGSRNRGSNGRGRQRL